MRRLLAILTAVLIGLPAVSPLFALGNAADASRPACCRRDGKHHCMLLDMESSPAVAPGGTHMTAVTVSERCPYGSKSLPGTTHPEWSLDTAKAVYADVVAHPSIAPRTESKRQTSADRSRQKRGPPAVALA